MRHFHSYTLGGVAVLAIAGATWMAAQRGNIRETREIGRLPSGPEAFAVRGSSGKWGIAVRGLPALLQAEPIRIELFSEDSPSVRLAASGYDTVVPGQDGLLARGSVAAGGATFSVEDRWSVHGTALRLERSLKVSGSGQGGFLSAATFDTARLFARDELGIFAPGTMYGDTGHLTKAAIGGADSFADGKWSALRVREDRLPAPMMGFRFPDGSYLAVLDAAPRGDTIAADSHDLESRTIIDARLRFGSLGAEPGRDRLSIGYWFPGTEGDVTYAGNTYPGGQKRVWRRRYHPIEDGLTQQYTVDFVFGRSADFPTAFHELWRTAWRTLAPAVNPQNIESVRRNLLDMLAEQAQRAPDGRTGIPNYIDAVDNRHQDRKAIMGFTGKNLEAANYLLEDTGPRAERHHAIAAAIFDSFCRLKVDPPEGEGFDLETGAPALAIARDKVVYLRSFGDDMKATLRAILYERRHNREHPEWLAWARRYADWLLTQQTAAGGFPRSWRPVTGEVADASPQSSYNVVPFLVLLSGATGDAKYRASAVRAAEFSWKQSAGSGRFVGGTIDNPDVIDKEAGTLSLEAYLALYEETREAKWLDRARGAADFAETWMYIWNVPMPVDEDNARLHWKRGVPTVGLQLISSGHSLVDAYMAFDTDEYARLYKYTKDAHYLEVARILLHNTKGMLSLPEHPYDLKGPGWQQEHWSLAPVRGFGMHRGWLPWVSTSHLNGIFELEAADPELFKELSGTSTAAPHR